MLSTPRHGPCRRAVPRPPQAPLTGPDITSRLLAMPQLVSTLMPALKLPNAVGRASPAPLQHPAESLEMPRKQPLPAMQAMQIHACGGLLPVDHLRLKHVHDAPRVRPSCCMHDLHHRVPLPRPGYKRANRHLSRCALHLVSHGLWAVAYGGCTPRGPWSHIGPAGMAVAPVQRPGSTAVGTNGELGAQGWDAL